jgi:hypothetical protein
MDWIKKHYDQFALALVAVALLAFSGLIILKARGFNENFTASDKPVIRDGKIKPLDMGAVGDAQKTLDKPLLWTPTPRTGSLFVSLPYIVDPATKQPRRIGGNDGMAPLHPPVPDSYILANHLDLLNPNVLNEDVDKDGFTLLDEWLGTGKNLGNGKAEPVGSTDPNDAKVHPPYHTKLFLTKWVKVPFRLRFDSIDGDIKKPETLTFSINTRDLKQPTEFLKMGDLVRNTKFKLIKFEAKQELNKKTDVEEDASELTLQNIETEEKVVLVITKEIDSPNSYALFSYLLGKNGPQPIQVKKLGEFALVQEPTLKYKVVDIKETEAVIALPSGEKYTVPMLSK